MKKIIALVLALCMVLSACVALADETEGLKDARSYINLMYKKKPASTPKDYELIGSVPGDTETYTVEWTTDSDTIAITRLESGMVKIDVDENNTKEVAYKLTATVKDAAGNESSISFDRFVPAAINLDVMTEEEIVAVAYALEDGAALPAPVALTGTIVAIPSAYSEQYDNVTVNIQVGDLADMPIQCYRLMGGSSLQVGDEITVLGTIKNYKGTIEFDKGCYTIDPAYAQSCRIAAFAYTLEDGAAFSHESTVTGVITAILSAYSPDYGNITVNIGVPGLMDTHVIQCYRLVGGEDLAEGDIITVTGTIKNYKGTIEFDKGCTYVKGIQDAKIEELAGALEELGDSKEEDFEGLLNGLLGMLNGKETSGEGLGELEGLLGDLSGLFGGEASGEGAGLLDGLSGLFGGEASSESTGFLDSLSGLFGGDESGEGAGFLDSLSGLFGSDASGEGAGLLDSLSGLFGSDESGESGDFMGLLSGLFSDTADGGERSTTDQEMTKEDWNALFNEVVGLFTNDTADGGERSVEGGDQQMTDEDWNALFNELYSLFNQE
ncbi:MAG: hypothetical protein IKN04_15505 [Clostridia bacterium]|nr:hypothetical protein [Clostridia bacterium]